MDRCRTFLQMRSIVRLGRLAILVALPSIIIGAGLGCTRKATKSSDIAISIQAPKFDGMGSVKQAISGSITFVVINVRSASGTISQKYELHNNPIPSSQGFSTTILSAPTGTLFIQALMMVEDSSTNNRVIAYGDVEINANSTDTLASITVTTVSDLNREGQVAGRFLTGTSPDQGPTGTLVMRLFLPNKPPMEIEEYSIINGWFTVMALRQAKFDYVLKETGQVLIPQLSIDASGQLTWAHGTFSYGNHFMKFHRPPTYSKNNSTVYSRPESEIYLGYIKAPEIADDLNSSHTVCYPNDLNEGAIGNYTAADLSTPVDIQTSVFSATKISPESGGTGYSAAQLYTGGATACQTSTAFQILPHHLFNGDSNLGGLSPPFQAIKPFRIYDQYIRTSFTDTPSPKITLTWSYLSGTSSVAGAVVYATSSTSNSIGGSDTKCTDLPSKGYSEVGTVSGGTATYDFTGTSATPLTAANKYNFNFAICAFRTGATGERIYLGRIISGGYLFDSIGQLNRGWANSSQNTTIASGNNYGVLGGLNKQIVAVTTPNSFYTLVQVNASAAALAFGDELMVHVSGMGALGQCGKHNGENIYPGQFDFVRVFSTSGAGPYYVRVTKDSLLDSLVSAANLSTTPAPGNNFCFVQVAKVLQYRDLTINSSAYLTTNAFNYMSTPGAGLLPIRVNGTLTMGNGSYFGADGAGYSGGASATENGGGIFGDRTTSGSSYTGGARGLSTITDLGGGGGGYGAGATGGGGNDGAAGSAYSGPGPGTLYRQVFGGGGGTNGDASSGNGHGGGAIFIFASTVYIGSGETATVKANGSTVSGYQGAGGGGSITAVIGKFTGSGTLQLTADGGGCTSNCAGPIGGGGSTNVLTCSNPGGGTISTQALKGQVGTTTTGAGDGDSTQISSGSSSYSWVCLN